MKNKKQKGEKISIEQRKKHSYQNWMPNDKQFPIKSKNLDSFCYCVPFYEVGLFVYM